MKMSTFQLKGAWKHNQQDKALSRSSPASAGWVEPYRSHFFYSPRPLQPTFSFSFNIKKKWILWKTSFSLWERVSQYKIRLHSSPVFVLYWFVHFKRQSQIFQAGLELTMWLRWLWTSNPTATVCKHCDCVRSSTRSVYVFLGINPGLMQARPALYRLSCIPGPSCYCFLRVKRCRLFPLFALGT